MAADITTFFFFFCSFSSLLTRTLSNIDICPPSSCSDDRSAPRIGFPFHLKNHQKQRCGYNASFELSCNTSNETILNLPNLGGGGEFIVRDIDYSFQILTLGDPGSCFIGRLLNSTFNNDFSPFRALAMRNFTFLNCSRKIVPAGELDLFYEPVRCLGGENHTVVGVEEGRYNGSWSNCTEIGNVAAPVSRPRWAFHSEMDDGIQLEWDVPNCRVCLASGGECGLKSGSVTEIDCMVPNNPSSSTGKSTGKS